MGELQRIGGGMDASQYKDYVLFMLFIKYISDKYADTDDFAPPVTIPPGASFRDMINLKGKSDIGDKINTQIIQPLIDNNSRLGRSDFPDFNDPNKLGEGKAMVDRLTNLVSIFQKPELDFSKNRADHDDILGDAYEYLMRHFASESGKSKGQFYTPPEVCGPIRVRLVKYSVAATTYTLATTLLDVRQYPIEELSNLYHARWGIEELYKISKQLMAVEQFHGQTERGVKQELFAHFVLVTLTRLFANRSEDGFNRLDDAEEKPEMQANFKNSLLVVGRNIEALMLRQVEFLTATVNQILEGIGSCRQRKRTGRSYERRSRKPESTWRRRKAVKVV